MTFAFDTAFITGAVILAVLVGVVVVWEKFLARDDFLTLNLVIVTFATLVVVPSVFQIGTNIARDSMSSFYEFWNALEVSADKRITECHRDGACYYEYSCDPYEEMVVTRDSEGNTQIEWETRYHRCPYVTHEITYTVTDSIGEVHVFGYHWFPENPAQHIWRAGHDWLPDVPSGLPVPWFEARERIESGNPGGVTMMKDYKNYILPLQNSVYEKFSDSIPAYLDEGLLPKVSTYIYDLYHAHKVYQVGLDLPNFKDWNVELQRFNGKFGARQGDFHLVLIDSAKVSDPDDYVQALNAYWLDESALGTHTLSKNGVVLVVGVDKVSGQAKWGRAFTGMPQGNESMLVMLQRAITNESIFADNALDPVSFFADDSPVSQILMNNYQRVKMKNFEYLKDSMPISDAATSWIIFFSVFFTVLLVAALKFAHFALWGRYEEYKEEQRYKQRRRYR